MFCTAFHRKWEAVTQNKVFATSLAFALKGGQPMATSALVLHKGAVPVEPGQLAEYPAPPPNGRHYPISHCRVLDMVQGNLRDAGYQIQKIQLGLTKDGKRFFGTLDLGTPISTGVSLAVGIRSSYDKS